MKKIISVIISFVLIISTLTLPAIAQTKNLFPEHIASSRGICMFLSNGAVDSTDKITNEMLNKAVDADTVNHFDIPEGLSWDVPRYFGMEFTLDSVCDIEIIEIYAGFSELPENYSVYVSDQLSNLYSEGLIAENIVCDGDVSQITVNKSVRYIAFVCTAFTGNQRLKEIKAIGTSKGVEKPSSAELLVKDNRLTDGDGNTLQLKGVNITEFSWSTFGDGSTESGKSNADVSIATAIETWGCNVIRLAVNTDFYLNGGTHKGVTKTAEEYRALVDKFVSYATDRGVAVVFDCHAYYGVTDAVIDFWEIAAPKYDSNELVMYGLINEPVSDWQTYFEGGTLNIDNADTTVYGIASVLDTVRKYSDNIAVIGGVDWAFDLSKFSSSDFDSYAAERSGALGISKESYTEKYYINTQSRYGRGIVLDSHVYSNKFMNWDYFLKNAISEYPILFGEFGPVFLEGTAITSFTNSEKAYLDKIFGYIEENNISYTAWGMNAWPFLTTPDGTVTPFGEAVKNDIAGIEFDSGLEENLIYTRFSSVRPILQDPNGTVTDNYLFYNQAHSDGSSVSNSIRELIIDADTSKHYDIYPAENNNNLGIEYTLNGLYAGSKIILSSGLVGYPDKYKVYASNSLTDLYSDANLVENMTAEISGSYVINIDRQVKYIAIIGNGYVRIKELELIGGKIGDFDRDNSIDTKDMSALRKKLLTNEGSEAFADMNSDKKINVVDLLKIKRVVKENCLK